MLISQSLPSGRLVNWLAVSGVEGLGLLPLALCHPLGSFHISAFAAFTTVTSVTTIVSTVVVSRVASSATTG